jgi:hypothetical protein
MMFSWKFFGISLLAANDCFQSVGLLLAKVEFEGRRSVIAVRWMREGRKQ